MSVLAAAIDDNQVGLNRGEFLTSECVKEKTRTAAASTYESHHLFRDEIDALKPTDFNAEVEFDLVHSIYRRRHGLGI